MKAHKYTVREVGASGEEITHTRIFIPEKGVIGYSERGLDFFRSDPPTIFTAECIIRGDSETEGIDYIGEIELPNGLTLNLIDNGRDVERAQSRLENSFRELRSHLND